MSFKPLSRGRSTYEATCVAGPFALSTRWTTSLQAALQQKQALLSIRARLEQSKDAQKGFRAALNELQRQGISVKDLSMINIF